MLSLPRTTEVNKPIFKKQVYAALGMDAKARESVDKDVAKLYLANEISPASVNIIAGEKVAAIFVMRVVLKAESFSENTISALYKLIGQNMVLVLEYETKAKLAVFYNKLYQTDWQQVDGLSVSLTGLNLDTVWDNIIKTISGGDWGADTDLATGLAEKERKEKIQKEIALLEKQAWKEKQPKKKFELVQKINKLKSELNK